MQGVIVVTGIGVVTAAASHAAPFWDHLLAGEPHLTPPPTFSAEGFRSKRATIVDPEPVLARLHRRYPETAARLPAWAPACAGYGLLAALDALHDAGLCEAAWHRAGLSIGTTSGGAMDAFSAGCSDDAAPPSFADAAPAHSAMTAIARALGLQGPVGSISAACTSSAMSIVGAALRLRAGDAEVMLAGGCDQVRAADFGGFNALRAMAPDLCRAFDAGRRGMIMGDGAAFLVLETEAHARRRAARPLARLAGFGASSDAYHATAPHPHGLFRAMQAALKDAGLAADAVGYVNCHGTGTPANDKAEAEAMARLFGESGKLPLVSSTKTTTGHLLGTAGALEAAIAVLVLRHGLVPPMTTVTMPDPVVSLPLALGEPQPLADRQVVMSNSLGFGGTNASLIFAAPATNP
jgi:3-oxoacyl-(acyl-carrier-protein) synthase